MRLSAVTDLPNTNYVSTDRSGLSRNDAVKPLSRTKAQRLKSCRAASPNAAAFLEERRGSATPPYIGNCIVPANMECNPLGYTFPGRFKAMVGGGLAWQRLTVTWT